MTSGCYAADMNYLAFEDLTDSMVVKAKIRYAAKESQAIISPVDNRKAKVVFAMPQRAITPGQSIVFYDDDIVIGGGIII